MLNLAILPSIKTVCQSVHPSVHLSVHLSVRPSIRPSIHPSSSSSSSSSSSLFQGLTAGAADPDLRVEILIGARIPPALTLGRATCVMVRGSKAGSSWLKAQTFPRCSKDQGVRDKEEWIPDGVFPNEFLGRGNMSWNGDVGCGRQGRGTENHAKMFKKQTQNGPTWAHKDPKWHPKSIKIDP